MKEHLAGLFVDCESLERAVEHAARVALGAELLYAGLIALAAVVDAKERAPYAG